jgi:uncharacterized protein
MQSNVLWQRMDAPGLEHMRLASLPDGFLADGLLLTVLDDAPMRASYRIQCDSAWRVRRMDLTLRRG